jgi:hypothetical protein
MQSEIISDPGKGIIKKPVKLLPFLAYFLLYTLFFFFDFTPIVTYSIIYITASLIYILLCFYFFKIALSKKYVFLLLICSIILRIGLLFIQPAGSDDYYRYVWDGKVMANGINPYQFAPADEELSHLHSNSLPRLVKYPEIKTVYPPLSLVLFYAGFLIGGESFWGIKILLLLFELFTFWGLFLILKELKLPQKNILLYALAPLSLFQLSIDAHVDGFGLPLLIFAIYFYLKKKNLPSLIFIGLAICIKPLGLLLIPIIFLNEKGIRAKIQSAVVPFTVCLILYLPFGLSVNVFEALANFTVHWTFNGFIFELLNSFIYDNQKTRLVCGILFLLVYTIIIFSSKDFLNKIYLAVFLLFIFSPIVHPWYIVWLAVLIPFIPKWSGILYISLISLTVFTVLNYQLYDEWKNYPAVLIFEYIPVLVMFVFEIYKGKFSTRK